MRENIYNYLLTVNRSKILHKILFLLLYPLLKITGKNIYYTFANKRLLLPITHSLPWNVAKHPTYSTNFGQIVADAKLSSHDIIIDIGANVGDTVALVRNESDAKIICIEGDEKYFDYLTKNTFNEKNIELIKTFVGETSGNNNTSLKVENGTARLVVDDKSTVQLKSLDDLLLNSLADKKLALIKIDTDGYDNKIIRGAKQLIIKHQPILFFEYDPYFLQLNNEKGTDIFELLSSWGYKRYTLYDNLGEKICNCTLYQMDVIRDLHNYFSGKNGKKYMDIAAYV